MKKIAVMFLMLISLLCLSSCNLTSFIKGTSLYSDPETQALYEEYLSLVAEKEELEAQYEALVSEKDGYNEKYTELENHLAELDAEINSRFSFYNELETETVKSNMLIYSEYEYVNNEKTYTSTGSGIVVYETTDTYYILTNNHVVASDSGKTVRKSSLVVYDYLSNKYSASIIYKDANYDMALLVITKSSVLLPVVKLADTDPVAEDTVITIGNPLLNKNCIAIGKIVKYGRVSTKSDASTVSYEVIYHTAYSDSGSSGGMLINLDKEVVGINTWKASTGDENSLSSPVSKIKEFLRNEIEV